MTRWAAICLAACVGFCSALAVVACSEKGSSRGGAAEATEGEGAGSGASQGGGGAGAAGKGNAAGSGGKGTGPDGGVQADVQVDVLQVDGAGVEFEAGTTFDCKVRTAFRSMSLTFFGATPQAFAQALNPVLADVQRHAIGLVLQVEPGSEKMRVAASSIENGALSPAVDEAEWGLAEIQGGALVSTAKQKRGYLVVRGGDPSAPASVAVPLAQIGVEVLGQTGCNQVQVTLDALVDPAAQPDITLPIEGAPSLYGLLGTSSGGAPVPVRALFIAQPTNFEFEKK